MCSRLHAVVKVAPEQPRLIFLSAPTSSIPTVGFNMKRVQRGHVTLKW